MATSNSTDPAQTLKDLLDGTPQGDWPNGTKPTHIETYHETDHRTRLNRPDAAVYARQSTPSEQDQLSTEGADKLVTETATTHVYSPDPAEAYQVAEDVQSILEDYWDNSQGRTAWTHGVKPQGLEDLREQHPARRSGQYVVQVEVLFEREAAIGTA